VSQRGPDGPFLFGIDFGTQSLRALLADAFGRTLHVAVRPTAVRDLGEGRAEYQCEQVFQDVLALLGELAQKVPAGGVVAGIAAASVGEACVLMDADGKTLAPVLAWFDRRTEPIADFLAETVGVDAVYAHTGQAIDSTMTLCKLLWYRQTDPKMFTKVRRVFNMADWIAFRLCGEAATDASLASRTLCMDLRTRAWSLPLLEAVELDAKLLPPIFASGTALGPVRPEILAATGLPGRPIVGVGGHDHVVGGFAAGSARPGIMLDSMGTAEALFLTVPAPLLTQTVRSGGYAQGAMGADRPLAYLGSGLDSSGGAVEWLRRLVGDAPSRRTVEQEAASAPPGSGGVCFVPHLLYSTPPHWDVAARGAFVGLTTATDRAALFRSVLEGLALEARLVIDAIAGLPGVGTVEDLCVIGGSTRNRLFMSIKASVMGRPLTVIGEQEATGLGAALLGGIAAGLWPGLDAAQETIEQDRTTVEPAADWVPGYAALYERVHRRLYSALRPINHALAALQPTPGA
jgi:xylulokinase